VSRSTTSALPPTKESKVPLSAASPPRQTVESTTSMPRGAAAAASSLHRVRVEWC
jgi:hypothetical protein